MNKSVYKKYLVSFVLADAGIIPSETKCPQRWEQKNLNKKRTFYKSQIFNMYNLTTNREMMPPSEIIENAEANCDAINDHIDSIGELT